MPNEQATRSNHPIRTQTCWDHVRRRHAFCAAKHGGRDVTANEILEKGNVFVAGFFGYDFLGMLFEFVLIVMAEVGKLKRYT